MICYFTTSVMIRVHVALSEQSAGDPTALLANDDMSCVVADPFRGQRFDAQRQGNTLISTVKGEIVNPVLRSVTVRTWGEFAHERSEGDVWRGRQS